MRMQWMVRRHGPRLVIFFAGWGMDARPFDFLSAGDCDVLFFFDYTELNLPLDLEAVLGSYAVVDMAAWSLGVAVANTVLSDPGLGLRKAVAVNGSVVPISEEYGISPEIFDATVAGLGQGGIEKFRRRMCGPRGTYQRFMSSLPAREPADLFRELTALRKRYYGLERPDTIFNHAWIGRHDRIIPAARQQQCWEECNVPFAVIDEPHFPFYRWSRWGEMFCSND